MDAETRARIDGMSKEIANLRAENAAQQRNIANALESIGAGVKVITGKIAEKEAAARRGTLLGEVKSMATISTNPPRSVLDRTKESVKEGAKLAAANEAGEVALDAMIALVPQLAELSKTPMGRAIGKALSAVALSYAAEASGFEGAPMVSSICDHVVTVSSMEITADKLKLLRPAFLKLADLSRTLAAAAPTASGPLTEG